MRDYDELGRALVQMKSFEAIKEVLNGIHLHDLQCIDVMKMIYSKRAIITYDTGTGKTLLAAAVMKLLWHEDPTRHFIMFVKKDQLIQTPKKLKDLTGREVLCSAANQKSLNSLLSKNFEDYSVLLLTHDCLDNETILGELYRVKDRYYGVFIDEAHELNNVTQAKSASMLAAIVSKFECCWALTATPITTSIPQLCKLASIVDNSRYPNFKKLSQRMNNGSFRITDDPCFFINRNGEDFGGVRDYHGIVISIEPHSWQIGSIGGNELMYVCKGPNALNQVKKLLDVLHGYQGKRGLVYINQHAVREWVLPFLDEAGIKYACINGKTKQSDRADIMYRFNEERSLDLVVTSVTTAIDLDCDFVIFYEFTVDVKQMIGRAHRGLGSKSLDVLFFITDETNEVNYFIENIMKRSFMVRDILGKSCKEMDDAERSINYAES